MSADVYLTLTEVAQELRISDESVRRAIKGGRLTAFRDGRVVRIRRSALDSYIERQTIRPTAPRVRSSR